nr:hypothetical protein [Tanacetum cinerariifolium]
MPNDFQMDYHPMVISKKPTLEIGKKFVDHHLLGNAIGFSTTIGTHIGTSLSDDSDVHNSCPVGSAWTSCMTIINPIESRKLTSDNCGGNQLNETKLKSTINTTRNAFVETKNVLNTHVTHSDICIYNTIKCLFKEKNSTRHRQPVNHLNVQHSKPPNQRQRDIQGVLLSMPGQSFSLATIRIRCPRLILSVVGIFTCRCRLGNELLIKDTKAKAGYRL